MSTPQERWRRVRAIFDLAADEPPASWAAIVAREAAGDDALQGQVLQLLAASANDRVAIEGARFDIDDSPARDESERVGTSIANYRLIRLLGRGGMGDVYEAVRADGVFDQRVAIKCIRAPHAGRELAARFRRERQILAALEHRNIARLLDGGTTSDGEPFFVMEYVEGMPITAYCDEHHLTIDQRLLLFRQVFAAVGHAHGKLIVHRDLKPANMLVAHDGSVKLLDFGVAKLLGAQDGDELTTMAATRLFTPEYASPEQLRDEPVSTASDVYALGVVLFELLAGKRPYDVPSRSPIAVLRAVESAGPLPRAVASSELDNILRTALRPDVRARYRSVEQFDDDVRRYLAGLPVSAQPDTLAYRAGKFVRRNVAGVTAASLFVLSLVAAVIVMFVQARRAAAERDWQATVTTVAGLEASGARQILFNHLAASDSTFQHANALCQSRPTRAEVTPVCLRVIQDLGVNARWHDELGRADSLLRRALALERAAPGTSQATIATTLSELAQTRDAAGDFAGAEQFYRDASTLFTAGGADLSPERLGMLGYFAICLERQGRFVEADSLQQTELFFVAAPAAGILLHVAAVHAEEGRIDLARAELERGTAGASVIVNDTGSLHHVLIGEIVGALRLRTGDMGGAIAQLREVLAVALRRYGADDPRLALVQNALGEAMLARHRAAEAAPLLDAAAATFEKRFGPAHPQTVAARRDAEEAHR
jgi:tRNA A-37 threonylcarbamoyl transferase component Bud32